MRRLYLLVFTILCPFPAFSQDLVGSLGQLPVVSESNDKGVLVDFLKALRKVHTSGTIRFEVMPFKRSMQSVLQGKSDFHAPILKDPSQNEGDLGFTYSTANIWDVIFALYTRRGNTQVRVDNLKDFNIETDAAHVSFFDFPIKPSTCLECSLKKVDQGRIDGFIFAAMESDEIIRKYGLKNVKSVAFRRYDGKFVLPLGKKGKETDALLSKLVKATQENGDYEKMVGKIVNYYKSWKPMQ